MLPQGRGLQDPRREEGRLGGELGIPSPSHFSERIGVRAERSKLSSDGPVQEPTPSRLVGTKDT